VPVPPCRLCAQALGATCLADFNEDVVTHVVSGRGTAQTVELARGSVQRRIHVVNPSWLLECMYRTERVSEENYPLDGADGVPHAPLERQSSAPLSVPWGRGAANGDGLVAARPDPRVDPRLASSRENDPRAAAYGSLAGLSVVPPSVPVARDAPGDGARTADGPPGDPRGRSAPAQATRGPPLPPKLPLHELEQSLDAELAKLVFPAQRAALLGHVKRVRNEREEQSEREASLTIIVEMVGAQNIEFILQQLGFYKPSYKPTNSKLHTNGR
jgi:hypothetical protein